MESSTPPGRPNRGDLASGIDLARQRAAQMRTLMESDPAAFVRESMPGSERAKLPPEIQPLIEQRVKARGFFGAYCGGLHQGQPGDDDHPLHTPGLRYEAVIHGTKYEAFVFGPWRDQATVREADIDGVVLGDGIAIGDSPTPAEQLASGKDVPLDAPNAGGTNTLLYIIASFSDETNSPLSDSTALSRMAVVNTFFLNNSSGTVSFRGRVNPAQVMDVVQVVLPQPMSYGSTYNNNFSELLGDARNAALAKGYNYANYNLDITVTSNQGFSYAGRAWVGGQGAHLISSYTSLRTAGHELGHNFGLYHADYWRTDSTQPFGRDSVPGGYVADTVRAEWIEYGHYFSVMSAQYGSELDDPTKPHFAAAEKVRLGWLSGSEVQYVNASGTYRLFRHDERATTGSPRGIRIETAASDYTGSGRRYWLNYRYSPWSTGLNWLRNGVQVDVCQTSYGSDGAIQLDMTPFSYDDNAGASYTDDNTDKRDGAVIVGRTYSDTAAGIHLTPISTGSNGTNEEFIDLVVNLGTFPGNRPPVIASFTSPAGSVALNQTLAFTVTASDPDGDTLAYSWDFDQRQVWTASGLNSPSASKSWPAAGQYRVVVTVSDMKGGIATAARIVTVGAPANDRQILGRVVWSGRAVYGARLWTTVGSGLSEAWTAADGTYALTDLAAANTYVVNCASAGLTFTPQFQNPVSVVAGNFYGADFYANEPLAGGSSTRLSISGQVSDGGTGVAGAEVRAGGMLATTDSSGNYQLTNFVPGTYTIAAYKDDWAFSPAARSVTLAGSDSTGNNFARLAPYSISGVFTGIPTDNRSEAPVVYLSNGRSVLAAKQGGGTKYWAYTLNNVPAGQFSLSASLGGYVLTPSGFSNPLTVQGSLANLNFAGTAGTVAGAISGRITRGGLPLPGVSVPVVRSGNPAITAITDSDGCYRADNLTSGSYTITPSLAGFTFSPTSQTASSVPASDKNFSASDGLSGPAITSLTASPNPVPPSAMASTLSAAVGGTGPLLFSWAAVSAAAPVTFSANDSTYASSTTASFQAPGDYTLRVLVAGTNGLSASQTIAVVVNAGPGSMVVTPYEIQVAAGQSVQFRADAWDQLGNPMTLAPQWSVTGGGSIGTDGLLAASAAGGPYLVTAVAGSLAATGTVWVTSPGALTPPAIVTQPASLAVAAGSNATFAVVASGSAPLAYQWYQGGAALVGATAASLTRVSVQSADAGDYTVRVTNTSGTVLSAPATLTVNNRPTLAPLAGQLTHPGALVLVTNVATDLDLPAQSLTFTLEPGAPAGAAINPTNGVFSWTPSPALANTTNAVSVRVTDNGVPPLSATGNFNVAVTAPLNIAGLTTTNGVVQIIWNGISGRTYRVEYKDQLDAASWTALTPDVVCSGTSASFTEPAGAVRRYYRLLLVR